MGMTLRILGPLGLVRTDRVCNGNFPSDQRSPDLWFDVSCFPCRKAMPSPTPGKNVLIGPGGDTTELDFRKIFDITEHQNLEFRFEPQREIQFALKLNF